METNPQPDSPNDSLQFDHAEPVNAGAQAATATAAAAAATCAGCNQPIVNAYYEIGGRPFCERCRESLLSALTGGSRMARFFKSAMFGLVAAIISGGIWIAITELTGYMIGLVAIVVGLIVGAAVRKGASGRGGWLYQGMAIVLTYLAITLSNVPQFHSEIEKHNIAQFSSMLGSNSESSSVLINRDGEVVLNGKPSTVSEVIVEFERLKRLDGYVRYHREGRDEIESPENANLLSDSLGEMALPVVYCSNDDFDRIDPNGYSFSRLDIAGKAVYLIFLSFFAIAAPFIGFADNLIGNLIIGFALWEAWKINKRPILNITGPHMLSPGVAHVATPVAMPTNQSIPSAWDNNPKHSSIDRDRKS